MVHARVILFHIHDDRTRPPASRKLGTNWTVVAVPFDISALAGWGALRHCLFDVDVTDIKRALGLRALLGQRETTGCRIFACPRGAHHAITQARALGANAIVDRPISDHDLHAILSEIALDEDRPVSDLLGAVSLDLAFRSVVDGSSVPVGHIDFVASHVASDIADLGIDRWLGSIRQHHAGTYQHCLIVTGLAAAFGQEIGLSAPDIQTLTVAALLHDIGKARIDPAILDKNGSLTPAERGIVEMHPVWGAEHLETHGDVAAAICDCVRRHHEFLDGSGYPDGLAGNDIDDLTRLLTIADIFGALVERRSYKEPMPGPEAFAVIQGMARAGKLERALVEAFRPVAGRLAPRFVKAA